jgi:hypothetical protein
MTKGVLFDCEVKVCIQLFWGNFDANVPFNMRQSWGKCFDDIISRAPHRDYANRKIEYIQKIIEIRL